MRNRPKYAQCTKHNYGLLIHDIEFVADGEDRCPGAGGEDGGFGDQRASGQRVKDGLGFFGGFLGRDIGGWAGGGEGGCQGGKGPGRESWAEP